jgi:hypothetical protein
VKIARDPLEKSLSALQGEASFHSVSRPSRGVNETTGQTDPFPH